MSRIEKRNLKRAARRWFPELGLVTDLGPQDEALLELAIRFSPEIKIFVTDGEGVEERIEAFKNRYYVTPIRLRAGDTPADWGVRAVIRDGRAVEVA